MSENKIDHKAEAESALEGSASSWAKGNDPHGYAQAHATLYLAEQQRIANLIAFATAEWPAGEYNRSLASKRAADRIRRVAAEGLGL